MRMMCELNHCHVDHNNDAVPVFSSWLYLFCALLLSLSVHTVSSGLADDLSETLLCISEQKAGSPSQGLQRRQLTRQTHLKLLKIRNPPTLIPIALKSSMCADSLCFSDPMEVHTFCPLWVFLRSGLAVPKAVARKPLPQKVSALDPSIRKQRPERGARYGCGRRKRRVL